MIDVKQIAKSKGDAASGGRTLQGGFGISEGTVEEASHALTADKAKRAETADEAEHAKRANNADRANFASVAGELSEDADVLQRYLRKDIDDTAKGVITFEQVQKALKGFLIGQGYQFDADGNIIAHSVKSDTVDAGSVTADTVTANDITSKHDTTDELVAQVLATIAQLKVKGDSTFSGMLSSPEFVSGFLAGKGWRIKNVPTLNAAGVLENKYTEEIDNLIVRGSMRVYEMIISQLLGENDNRIFTAMLEVDHYDTETGKVYLDTKEGRYYNPFRKDDCIMVQQYNGMPSAENNYYVTKNYELIVTEVGSEGSGEDMLAWVKFRNFTCSMEGATPEQMITKKDTFVRVDNLTDPDRKGIIQMMTVGSDTPYMDVIHGLKTDPENALKGRLGNLEGIVHPIFGALRGFGEYLNNLYATGDLILRRTGESIDTKFQMLENMFSTRFAQTSYDLSNDSNYLENGQFLQKVDATESETLIDGWGIESKDDIQFWVDANGLPMMVNGMVTTSGNHRVTIEGNEGRNMLRIQDCGISQKNALIRKPGTHKEYTKPSTDKNAEGFASTGDGSVEVQDKLYVSLKIYAKAAGTLTMGFEGCSTVEGKENDLAAKSYDIPYGGEWQVVKMEGKWNGTGNFIIRFTGDAYISLASITDEPLEEFSKTVSTQIQQTATNIKLLGENIDKVNGTTTQLGIDLDTEKKEIRQYVKEVDETNRTDTSSQITQTANDITSTVNQTIKDQYNTVTEEYGSAIKQSANEIQSWVEGKSYSTTGQLETAKTEIKQTTDAITLSASKAQKTADGAVSSISELSVTVDGIKTTVGKKVDNDTYKKAIDALDKAAATAQGTADTAVKNASAAQSTADTAVTNAANAASAAAAAALAASTAETNAKDYTDSSITQSEKTIMEKVNKVSFDDAGNVTNISTSGLVTTSNFSGLFTTNMTKNGVVTNGQMSVYVTKNDDGYISNASIGADRVILSGHTMAFSGNQITIDTTNFKLDASGNVTMKGAVTATSGKIGSFSITNRKDVTGFEFYDLYAAHDSSGNIEACNVDLGYNGLTVGIGNSSKGAYADVRIGHGGSKTTSGFAYSNVLYTYVNSNYGSETGAAYFGASGKGTNVKGITAYAAGGTHNYALYADKGLVKGAICPSVKVVSSDYSLTEEDNFIICTNPSNTITLTFPASPATGQMYFVIQTSARVNFAGNGHSFRGRYTGPTGYSGTGGQINIFVFDGSNWSCSYAN